MANLYTKGSASAGTSVEFDNLIYDITVDQRSKGVTLKGGQGILKRGTVLGIITASSLAVPANSANSDGSQSADCILTDNVDTGSSGAADVPTEAYSAGSFNRQALTFGGTDTAAKHENTLRGLGIYLSDSIAYPQV